jgi:hypothetical protein
VLFALKQLYYCTGVKGHDSQVNEQSLALDAARLSKPQGFLQDASVDIMCQKGADFGDFSVLKENNGGYAPVLQ